MPGPMKGPYISTRKFAQTVGCCLDSVPKVAAAARVRTKVVPGMPIRYHRDDVAAIAAKVFQVAGEEPEPAAVEARRPAAAAV